MAIGSYETGKGMFGGIKGSYGRYSVGPRVGSISSQFKDVDKYEDQQRRRVRRKKESGYTGEGFWYSAYPNMVGAMSSGTDLIPRPEKKKLSKSKRTASASDTMGVGGTTFNGGGAVI